MHDMLLASSATRFLHLVQAPHRSYELRRGNPLHDEPGDRLILQDAHETQNDMIWNHRHHDLRFLEPNP